MEVGTVPSPAVLDALAAVGPHAAAEANPPQPGTAAAPLLQRETLAERLLGPMPTPADASNAPARHVEHGAETATVQTFARTDTSAHDRQQAQARPGDAALPAASHRLSEFALPAAQLVPAAMVGLQTDAPVMLPLGVATPVPFRRVDDDEPERRRDARDDGEDDEADPPPEAPAADEAPEAPSDEPDEVLDPADAGCDAVARLFAGALATPPAVRLRGGAAADGALAALREQWLRGRCAVIACPQRGADGAAWAFVLRPRRGGARNRLTGVRVAARLQWRQAPHVAGWLHSRMAKEHTSLRGRQLVPLAPGDVCEVQLGPVLAERRRPCDVRLRIDAARRFWTALGDQWSVLVVICSFPLSMEVPC
jgi:hypothetical protein